VRRVRRKKVSVQLVRLQAPSSSDRKGGEETNRRKSVEGATRYRVSNLYSSWPHTALVKRSGAAGAGTTSPTETAAKAWERRDSPASAPWRQISYSGTCRPSRTAKPAPHLISQRSAALNSRNKSTHRISHDSNRMTRRQSRQSTRQARCEVNEAGVERVRCIGRETAYDEDGDDETVHGDDTCHDDRDERLW
jgi:hypothetical protein